MDRKASIQEQTIRLITVGLRSSPDNRNNAPETCGGNSINQLRCAMKHWKSHWKGAVYACWLFFLSFFLSWMGVDNMMSFTRTYLWEIFVFLFGAFTSSVFKNQHKTPIYFLSWKMSALCWALPRIPSPPPPQPASSGWLQQGVHLWHCVKVEMSTFLQPWTPKAMLLF